MSNELGDGCAEAFIACLGNKNSSLKDLDLRGNKFSSDMIQAIKAAKPDGFRYLGV